MCKKPENPNKSARNISVRVLPDPWFKKKQARLDIFITGPVPDPCFSPSSPACAQAYNPRSYSGSVLIESCRLRIMSMGSHLSWSWRSRFRRYHQWWIVLVLNLFEQTKGSTHDNHSQRGKRSPIAISCHEDQKSQPKKYHSRPNWSWSPDDQQCEFTKASF